MENSPGACVNMCSKYVTIFQKLNESKCLSVFLFLSALSLLRACALVGGPCAFSVSPSPFGLDFGTLDFGLWLDNDLFLRAGFSFAGLEYGTECYCGHNEPDTKRR